MGHEKNRIKYFLIILVLVIGIIPGQITAADKASVTYQTHVQNLGWQDYVSEGLMSGTTGKSLRLEGIRIKLDSQADDLGISYQTHIQNIGWEAESDRGWKLSDEMSGTQGLSYRLEAIAIKLTGNDADHLDIFYQVHAQNMGWLNWAKNGEKAGTAGYSYRLEGIRILILEKGESPPAGGGDQDFAFVERKSVAGNLLKHSGVEEFSENAQGLDDVILSPGLGGITLKEGVKQGVYTSKILNTRPFNKLVFSWSSDTPPATLVQVEARVIERIWVNGQEQERYSDWLSFGRWGTSIQRASGTGVTDGPLAKVDVDTLIVKDGKMANKIQYRVILHSDTMGTSPSVRLIAGALRNTHQEIDKVFSQPVDLSNLQVLNVPQFSQMTRDPAIANAICSPTSVAMVLNYYGTGVSPEQAAWGVYDYDFKGFGNWPFNTAYASSFGYTAYVDYSTIEGLKRQIAKKQPVIVAVAYKNSPYGGGSLPLIDGGAISVTDGHLIVIKGFVTEGGVEYIMVNDPAAGNDAEVHRRYRLDQFRAAWAESGKIAYIIHKGK